MYTLSTRGIIADEGGGNERSIKKNKEEAAAFTDIIGPGYGRLRNSAAVK